MAIYHCSASTIGRSSGRSIVAAAAYRAGAVLTDQRTGLTHDFSRKRGILHTEIMAPLGAPPWATDRAQLWNAAERAEDKSTRRATATTGREFCLALPHELTRAQRLVLVRAFARYMVDTYGVVVDFALHAPDRRSDDRNFHAHILITDRRMTDAGFGEKVRELNIANGGKRNVCAIRKAWADLANRHLEMAGIDARIDHRSYEAQWIDREATQHLGPSASAMERRGERSDIGDANRAAQARNQERAAVEAATKDAEREQHKEEVKRKAQAESKAEDAAARTYDPASILTALTERRATFSEAELNALLRRTIPLESDRAHLCKAILTLPELVPLTERGGGPVVRFTSKTVLRREREALKFARQRIADKGFGLADETRVAIMERGEFGPTRPEQYLAFRRATGPEGLAMIAGQAGTGKSYTMAAIRQAYEAEGARVVGLSFTNKVIQDMKRDGFREVSTVTGAMQDVFRQRARWDHRTVLMVDEAAMLSTRDMLGLLMAADYAGAKLVLVGDDRQLASAYLHGGLFGALRERHGDVVSELSEIHRIRDHAPDASGQRRAFNAMHDGRFREALDIFDRQGFIQWSDTRDEARAALAKQYAADLDAHPQARRFAFTHTNADAKAVNEALRDIYRARGMLGPDHALPVQGGSTAFAVGDRIQLTGSAYRKADRQAGLANGVVGTIRIIEGMSLTIAIDARKEEPPRLLSFTVGGNQQAGEFNAFQHGYAGTVYKGQGATVDISYRLHGGSEGAATSYVGASRHAETMHLFASRETVRGAGPWMGMQGGLDGLTEAQRQQAEKAFARWAPAHPEIAERRGLAGYVTYVQGQWTEEKARDNDLNQLARQMGRPDECRAAIQFQPLEAPPDTSTPPATSAPPAAPSAPSEPHSRYSPAFRRVVDAFDLMHRRTVRQAAADVRAAADEDKESGGRWDRFRAFWRNRMEHEPDSPAPPRPDINTQPRVDDSKPRNGYDNRPTHDPKPRPGGIDP
ncbi:MobQ family relaxase [Niveispirillum sp.]|uniref:MobQ family relaxase n=1 Tax=Niveispirillum sp. TaxID=1917217 RepID=UPI001B6615FC|nr:MobQ family relaxase [Niveispirillum sp.]MBP7340489.1 MobA/MobL family protein [Niveispirillum sp.]